MDLFTAVTVRRGGKNPPRHAAREGLNFAGFFPLLHRLVDFKGDNMIISYKLDGIFEFYDFLFFLHGVRLCRFAPVLRAA